MFEWYGYKYRLFGVIYLGYMDSYCRWLILTLFAANTQPYSTEGSAKWGCDTGERYEYGVAIYLRLWLRIVAMSTYREFPLRVNRNPRPNRGATNRHSIEGYWEQANNVWLEIESLDTGSIEPRAPSGREWRAVVLTSGAAGPAAGQGRGSRSRSRAPPPSSTWTPSCGSCNTARLLLICGPIRI